MNKCFLLNLQKNRRRSVFEKNAKNAHFNSENDVTDPKARIPETMVSKP